MDKYSEDFQFLHNLANTSFFFFNHSHFERWEMISLMALIYISLMTNNVEHLSMCLFAIHIPFFGDTFVQISSLPLTHWVTASKWLLCASDSVKQRTVTVPTSWRCCDSASSPRALWACPHSYSTELFNRQVLYAWSLNSSFIKSSSPHLCT